MVDLASVYGAMLLGGGEPFDAVAWEIYKYHLKVKPFHRIALPFVYHKSAKKNSTK